MSDLAPCPFCGGKPEWNTGKKGDGTPWRYLACEDCEAMGPHVADWELSAVAPDAESYNNGIRIEAWNRRAAAPPPATSSAVEALRRERFYAAPGGNDAGVKAVVEFCRNVFFDKFASLAPVQVAWLITAPSPDMHGLGTWAEVNPLVATEWRDKGATVTALYSLAPVQQAGVESELVEPDAIDKLLAFILSDDSPVTEEERQWLTVFEETDELMAKLRRQVNNRDPQQYLATITVAEANEAARRISARDKLINRLLNELEDGGRATSLVEPVAWQRYSDLTDSWSAVDASYAETLRAGGEKVRALVPAASLSQLQQRIAEVEADYLAEARINQFVAEAIGSTRFMDPPDGGGTTLPEQVTRMRQALEAAEAALEAKDAKLVEAVAALEPFAAAGETARKVADLHGENEFVLSFGPVPVGVIPLEAFVQAALLRSSTEGDR